MLKPICIIPARGGSKGVKRKNIRPLGGKPLIAYTLESAINSNLFQDVIVTTEDEEIANISKNFEIDYWGLSNKNLTKKLPDFL